MVSRVEKTIDINRPARIVYDQWTQFESFPDFMERIDEVSRVDNGRVRWRGDIAGVAREWEVEMTEQIPGLRIAWRSVSGPRTSSVVTLQPLSANSTRVTLRMDYHPEGFLETSGEFLGVMDLRVGEDMRRFRTFMEDRTLVPEDHSAARSARRAELYRKHHPDKSTNRCH